MPTKIATKDIETGQLPSGITVATAPLNDNDTSIANTAFVNNALVSKWGLLGNTGTGGTGIVGTLDNQPFSFYTNNTNRGGFSSLGNLSLNKDVTINSHVIVGKGLGSILSNIVLGSGPYTTSGGTGATGGNIMLGWNVGYGLTTGGNNTLVGTNAGNMITTGSANTIIGLQTGGGGLTTGSNNTFIGQIPNSVGVVSNNAIIADGQGNIKLRINENGAISINNSYGTAGQAIVSNGSGSASTWSTVSGGGGGGVWGSITGTLSSQTDLNTALNLKAPLASPTLTGVPTAPTATLGTDTTQIATTEFVENALVDSTVYFSTDFSGTGTALDPIENTATYFSGDFTGTGTLLDPYAVVFPTETVSSLTTTGSSGAATLIAGVLNIPNYAGGGGSQTPWTSDIDADQFALTDASQIDVKVTTEASQNLLLQSETMTVAPWVAESVDITANQEVDLEGNTTLDMLDPTFNVSDSVFQPVVVSASTTYYLSWDVKRGTSTDVWWGVWDSDNFVDIVKETYYADTSATVSRVQKSFTTGPTTTNIIVYPFYETPVLGTIFIGRVKLSISPTSGYAETTTTPVTIAGGTVEALHTDSTGRTGLGKTNPTEKLDVVGNVRFSGALMPNNTAGTDGQTLFSTGPASAPAWGNITTQGTYTPTLYNTTNIAASTAYLTNYLMVGQTVFVWGEVSIDATAASTISELGMDIPVPSAIITSQELAGTASFEDNTVVKIAYDTINGRAKFRFTPQTDTNNRYSFHFSYLNTPA